MPNSTVPEQDYETIQRKHSDYESNLKSIQSKIMKDCIKDRFSMILVSTALLKLSCNLIHSSQHENKFILCKTNIKLSLKHSSISFSFFHSFILNCLGMKAYQTYQTVYQEKGKTCFYSTNDVLLLFTEDTSYNGTIADKCFIFSFVWHFKFYFPLYWKLWLKILY